MIDRKREINQMKFYDEEKLLKIRNILIVAVLIKKRESKCFILMRKH